MKVARTVLKGESGGNAAYLLNSIKKNGMDIGKNLKSIRESKNLSQQAAADFVNVDRKTYMNWEAGVTDVKSSFIPQLAEFFNVEIKDFFKMKNSNIVINQHNTCNKDHSVNRIIILLNEKEAVNELAHIIKEKWA